MKTLSLAAIGVGMVCLVVAVVEKSVGPNLFKVAPTNYVHLASAFFLLSVALMCHDRFYCSNNAGK